MGYKRKYKYKSDLTTFLVYLRSTLLQELLESFMSMCIEKDLLIVIKQIADEVAF